MAVAQAFEFIQTEDSKKKLSCAERTTFRCSDSGQGKRIFRMGLSSNSMLSITMGPLLPNTDHNDYIEDTFDIKSAQK